MELSANGASRRREQSISNVWRSHNLKPHRIKSLKLSRDVRFMEKLTDVVGLYLNPPDQALVLCVDEKTQIQALDRTQPGLRMKKGRLGTMTHDYKRNGTTCLFAALEGGEGIRAIAKQLGCSRNTVRRYLREAQAKAYGPRAARVCKLDEYKDYLLARIEQARPRWIPAPVLLREIQQRGYAGGISELKAWIAPHKKAESDQVVRFETPPGKQIQADVTTVRRERDPLLALVATMGYSRASFVKFTRGEDAATLCAGLREAFDYFGGVPEHVLFDNAKSVVIDRDAYGEGLHRWNDELKELAEACGFTPRLCRPYRAKTKGKVERFNSYLKGSLVVPLAATVEAGGLKLDVVIANVHVRRWLDEVANARVHATTKDVPAWRLAEERAVMLPAPALMAAPMVAQRVALPIESLQHPLSVYDQLLEVA